MDINIPQPVIIYTCVTYLSTFDQRDFPIRGGLLYVPVSLQHSVKFTFNIPVIILATMAFCNSQK